MKATFTEFEPNTNWCKGEIGKFKFEAKLFDVGSTFGIDNGRISKLMIWDEKIRQKKKNIFKAAIVNYDRGWDIEPIKANKKYYESVKILLENAPARF